ncbi:T9SS type A sorting domain-containing protein [candidate division WOR-3 bacterium]|nr:T9SS type A sorting domain-containing protein [candidate division WOR-3 bacterium]
MENIAGIMCVLVCLTLTAQAEDVELTADQDASIWATKPDSSFGTQPSLFILGGTGAEDEARALIRFDLDQLPSTEDFLQEALLRLWVSPDTDYVSGGHAGVYMVAGDWDEAVTWNSMPPEDRSVSEIGVLPPHSSLWFEQDITDIVHAWLHLDADNYGLYVEVPDGTPYAFPRFAAREYSEEEYLPRLKINYTTSLNEKTSGEDLDLRVSTLSTGKVEVRFGLPTATHVSCRIYDASGKLVKVLVNEEAAIGDHRLIWGRAETGIYFVRFVTPERSSTRKLVLARQQS